MIAVVFDLLLLFAFVVFWLVCCLFARLFGRLDVLLASWFVCVLFVCLCWVVCLSVSLSLSVCLSVCCFLSGCLRVCLFGCVLLFGYVLIVPVGV